MSCGRPASENSQLFNIVRGDMGLVGPRPLLLMEAEKFGHTTRTVLRVKPGLTGL
ncbi:MAG: sugar transferase [Acidimicrobiales bacterium]